MKLLTDYSNCLNFVEEDTILKAGNDAMVQLETLLSGEGKGSDFLGWINLPEEARKEADRINVCAGRLRSQASISIVIGIGGSYLGSKAVLEVLRSPFDDNNEHRIIYAGHHLSEDYHSELVSYLSDKDFNIIVISKSGTTTEPAIAFRLLKNLLEKKLGKEKSCSHIVAISDKSCGALRELAVQEGYETFVIPDNVGGRYSVLTPVGLLPIATAGFDISAFIIGAEKMAELTLNKRDARSNPALLYAGLRNILLRKGYSIEMLVNYEPALHYVGEWWKQLFGESEGKDGKGIFPASADFTSDLHSLGQYIQDGQRILFETVISVESSNQKLIIPSDSNNLDKLNFVAGKRMSEVNQKAEEGTIMAHIDGGVPVIRLQLSELSESSLGELLFFFEISCAISGYILGINPFDQPGVEAYKKNMFKLLGKEGY
ncbi:MAG: glucose-6-phosphate isomerase [Bacteroidales bacterium]|nr:glucose-6-phosphate isomerase [Bacteroidales bacterium]